MMGAEDKISQLGHLFGDVREYINLRFDALKLRAVDHLSSSSGLLFSVIIGMLLFMCAFLFIMAGFTYWLGQALRSPAGAMFIIGGFIACLSTLVLLWRKHIFTNRMVRFFLKIFFNPASPDLHQEKPAAVKDENDEA
ncbi:MAG: hypothetical protein LBF39_03365 [Prevotellaceae bacterium]|jgi:hypothetical protein|nr:hypothetical protein [Prevotellaceae bacterium]